MSPDEKKRILALYHSGDLGETERARLIEASIADQDLFDALMDDHVFAALGQDDGFNRALRYALRRRQIWYQRPLFWSMAGAGAILAVVLAVRPWTGSPGVLPPSAPPDTAMLSVEAPSRPEESGLRDHVMRLSPRIAIPGSLSLVGGGPLYHVGGPMRVEFRVERDATALLLDRRGDGSLVRLFPNRLQSSPGVAGGEVRVPPQGQGSMRVEGSTGARVLRLVLAPPDVDIFSVAALERAAAENRLSVIDPPYTVN